MTDTAFHRLERRSRSDYVQKRDAQRSTKALDTHETSEGSAKQAVHRGHDGADLNRCSFLHIAYPTCVAVAQNWYMDTEVKYDRKILSFKPVSRE